MIRIDFLGLPPAARGVLYRYAVDHPHETAKPNRHGSPLESIAQRILHYVSLEPGAPALAIACFPPLEPIASGVLVVYFIRTPARAILLPEAQLAIHPRADMLIATDHPRIGPSPTVPPSDAVLLHISGAKLTYA